ncbi:MAG: superoxide dismutase family protein, partial [Dokdonella sp.]
ADGEGKARVDSLATGVTLGGGDATDVMGKAIVLHKKADDYTSQPAGDSGDRIACGVIR